MILAYRKKTGCKQYIFETFPEMFHYFKKKWYNNDVISWTEFSDKTNREIDRGTFPGGTS